MPNIENVDWFLNQVYVEIFHIKWTEFKTRWLSGVQIVFTSWEAMEKQFFLLHSYLIVKSEI